MEQEQELEPGLDSESDLSPAVLGVPVDLVDQELFSDSGLGSAKELARDSD